MIRCIHSRSLVLEKFFSLFWGARVAGRVAFPHSLPVTTITSTELFSFRFHSSNVRCPPDWKLFNGSCFVAFIKPTATWDEARHACRSLGGDLAKITSAAENTFAYGLISGKVPNVCHRRQKQRLSETKKATSLRPEVS